MNEKEVAMNISALHKAIEHRWMMTNFYENNNPYYFDRLEDNLIAKMSEEDIDDYRRGGGNELDGKMKALHSSSAMTFNVFCNKKNNRKVNIIDNEISRYFGLKEGIYNLEFEKQLPALDPKAPANLDACLSSMDRENIILFEMKMTEWFKKPEEKLKSSYLNEKKYLTSQSAKVFIKLFKEFMLEKNVCKFVNFDVFQFIKHILGVYNEYCTKESNKPTSIKLIAGFWTVPGRDFFSSMDQYRSYPNIEKNLRKEFKEFKEQFTSFKNLLFKDIEFDIQLMTVREIIDCMEKTVEEKKALQRYVKRNFVHLHVHTEYSIGDGVVRIKNLISRAKKFGMDAVAITDNCVLNGAADFYLEAKKQGIKPIIGCEVYLTEEPSAGDNNNAKNASHLVLLAENQTGYHNLTKLLSQFNNKSMTFNSCKSYESLREFHDGIICLSGSEDGMLYRYLKDGNEEQAETLVKRHINLFGKNNYFLELQQHGREEDRIVNEGLKRLAKMNGLSLVATNAVRYLRREDQALYAVWGRICEKHNCNNRINVHDDNREYYFKTAEEMDELFIDYPEALENTRLIAERCNVNLKFSRQKRDSHPILVSFHHRSLQYWQPILDSLVGSDESKVEEAIIDYAKKRYGYTYAARIASTGHFTIGAAIREVGSILDIPSDEVECILGLVNGAIEYDEGFYANLKKMIEKSSKLRKAYREKQHVKRLVDLAYGIQHLIFHYGAHATAFVLAPKPLEEYFPLQICYGCFATEYTCKSLEGLGIEKMILEE